MLVYRSLLGAVQVEGPFGLDRKRYVSCPDAGVRGPRGTLVVVGHESPHR
jgi:hypothetical protein